MPGARPWSEQEKLLMENNNPKEIKTHETFENLFPIRDDLLKKIEEDMTKRQYDHSQPVILATWEGQKEPVCIDGHTRLRAAINQGIDQIPVFTHELNTEQEALELAIHLQRNRRNMTDAEILLCVEKLDKRRPRGGDRKSEEAGSKPQGCGNEGGRSASAKELAGVLGISPRKVEQTRTVLDYTEPDIADAVRKQEMSINRAYKETQQRKKEAQRVETAPAGDCKVSSSEATDCNEQVETQEKTELGPGDGDAVCGREPEERTDFDEPGMTDVDDRASVDIEADHETETEEETFKTVRISSEQYEALSQWEGEIEDLVSEAIERFLEYLEHEGEDDFECEPEDEAVA
jgi:hypothetical protein